MSRSAAILAGLVLAAMPLVGGAQSPSSSSSQAALGPLPTAEGGLEQLARNKETMVARLLGDSPLARRIVESNHPQAFDLYRAAQQRFEQAREQLAAGTIVEANAGFDAAMQAMHQARKLLSDAIGDDGELQVRFGGLLKSLESLRRSYQERFLADVPAGAAMPSAPAGRLAEIDALVAEARIAASGGRVADGVANLQKAERMLMQALQQAIGSDTIEYRRQGRTPEQVYRDELGRNQSYVELVPIALNRLNPSPQHVSALSRQVELNDEARGRAERSAAAQDLAVAIDILQRATADIENLLREAGLAIPRE